MINPKGKRKSSYIQSRDINGNIIYLDPITGKEVSHGVEQGITLQASYPIKKYLMINLDVQKKHNERIKSGQSVMIRGKEVRVTPKQTQVYLSTDRRSLSMKDASKLSYELDYKLLQLDKAVNLTTTALGNFSNYFLPSTYAGALVDKLEGKNSFSGSLIEGNNGLGSVGTNLIFDLASPLVLGKGFSLMTTLGKEAKPVLYKVSNTAKPLTNRINWLYNDGNIFNAPMRYNPNNFYRGVGKEALKDAKESGVIRGKYFKNPYFGKGKDWWNDGVVYEGSPERTAWIDAYPYDEEGKVIPFSNQFPFNALPYENGSTIVPTKSFSYWRKYPLLGWRKNSFRNVKTPTITAENAASVTPEQWTAAQDAAIARGDMAEAQRLRDLHFRVKTPNNQLINELGEPFIMKHYGNKWTEFNPDETMDGVLWNADENAFKLDEIETFEKVGLPTEWKNLFINMEKPIYDDVTNYTAKLLSRAKKGDKEAAEELFKTYGVSNPDGLVKKLKLTEDALRKQGLDVSAEEIQHLKDIGVYGEESAMSVAPYPNKIKLADAITYDDAGNIIPLSQRDNFNINDIRYGLLPFVTGLGTLGTIYKTNKKAHGGKMNILQFLKNGSGIHIKKENKGKFTDYCGGKVTSECIAKGKRSSNPAVRKRATFAANVRKWKHKEGGKAFVKGVSILDSNPDAYKYVKKKLRSALLGAKIGFGLKIGNFLNSDTGKSILNLGQLLYSGISDASNKIKQNEKLQKWKQSFVDSQSLSDAERQKFYAQSVLNQQMNNPDGNVSDIVASHDAWKLEQLELQKRKKEAEANLYITQMSLIDNNELTGGNGFNFAGMASDILSGVLGNSSKTQAVTNPSSTYSLFKMPPIDFTVNMKL